MTDIEYLKNIMDCVEDEKGDHEPGYVNQWPMIREKISDTGEAWEQDKRFILAGKFFADENGGCLNEDHFDITADDPWYWHIAEIVRGEYPLEKIPEHVREIAGEMYY